MEITEEVQELNRLIVTIEAYRRPDRVPMDNTDWFNYGGLYRDVLLLRLPPVFIKDWFLRLVPDGTFSSILLDVEVDRASISKPVPDMEVRLQIMNLGVDVICPLREGRGQLMVRAKPSLWSPEQPFLYNVSLSLISKSSEKKIPDVIDQVQDRVGFREVRVEGQKILLNGNPMFLKGISVHEDHLLLGKTTNEEIIRATIQDLKALHGNYLRLSHYPHDARFARIADEEGVLLWEEIPVYWAIAFTNPDTYADAENQLSELVQRDRNRASVIIWSVGNENADTDSRFSFMARLVEKARVLDGTRPVSAACLINTTKLAIEDRLAEVLDIIGVNEYYGWYDPDFEKLHQILENSNPRKPVILCEFGGGARAGHRGTEEDLFSEDRQEWIYKRQLDLISSCPYIQGMSPWILYDFRCPRRLNRYQELFNRKGLIDSDRKTKKRAFCLLSTFYRDIKK
jgi:beta-glucuronidase